MKDAVRKGHMGCLKLMAESVRSRFLLKSAFTFFAKSQVEEMKRDMDYFFGDVLEYAARNGHLECMKMMLKYVDPKVKESSALRSAAYSGHEDCFCCFSLTQQDDTVGCTLSCFKKFSGCKLNFCWQPAEQNKYRILR